MYKSGHLGISLLLYAPIISVLFGSDEPIIALAGLAVVVYTASLPDIDIKAPLRYFIGHRTWTHSLWFAVLVGLLTGAGFALLDPVVETQGIETLFVVGFLLGVFGVLCHLVGDVLTYSGIQPLYPIGPRYSVNLTSAKGLWWFEDTKSGNQTDLTWWESLRHRILNSNRVFLVVGVIACGAGFAFEFVPV
jgi:inner membrane protein